MYTRTWPEGNGLIDVPWIEYHVPWSNDVAPQGPFGSPQWCNQSLPDRDYAFKNGTSFKWLDGTLLDGEKKCPRITVGCCPNDISEVLLVTAINFGGCDCCAGATCNLFAGPHAGEWTGRLDLCAGKHLNLRFYCFPPAVSCGDWRLDIAGDLSYTGLTFTAVCACNPLNVWFLPLDTTGAVCGTPGFINLVISELP